MPTIPISSRSTSPSSGEDTGSIRGSIEFGEILSDESSHRAGSIRMSPSNVGAYPANLLDPKISPWNHSNAKGFPHPIYYLTMIGGAFPPNHFNVEASPSCPLPIPLASHFSAAPFSKPGLTLRYRGQMPCFTLTLMGILGGIETSWDLKLNLTGISTFERQVLALEGCLESGNEAALLKPSDEVELLLESAAPSLPQSASPIDTTHPVIISTSVPMLGSSRLRELKLKRSRKTRLRGFKRTLKKFVKIL
ncbi:hypothetical protein PSHT_03685 [Puccinia striiformis]|uniref:Uncharacterized protein n=1 Tax=Puccinia striiformis TaxID=27350 RepID=A0A2S4WEY3_9BASI|nr:hypothetical protein PSHT_03685 [Puccinia striiformis]